MESAILGENPDTVAEVIVEPIMSGIGVAVPPDEYLKEVETICRRYGILLHVDEVINGFGRTGKMFAHQHYGVSPDIIAIAKGISRAYMPIAATAVKNRVFEQLLWRGVGEPAGDAGEHLWRSSGRRRRRAAQYRDPGGGAAGRSGGGDRRLSDGRAARRLLRHPIVGDVRGKGLLQAIELVKDRATKEPVDASVITSVVEFCRDNGVIVGRAGGGRRFSNVIVLSPPLVITRAECDRLVDTLDRALAALPAGVMSKRRKKLTQITQRRRKATDYTESILALRAAVSACLRVAPDNFLSV